MLAIVCYKCLCLELDNPDIMDEHCNIEYEDEIMLIPKEGLCAVNRKQITEPVKLFNGKNCAKFRKIILHRVIQ